MAMYDPKYTANQITGFVDRIIFSNIHTNYAVVALKTGQGVIPCTGSLAHLHIGQQITLFGYYYQHPRYGRQFHVNKLNQSNQQSIKGIKAYLSSQLVPHIGPKTAQKIIDHFKQDTLTVLNNKPNKLVEIKGLTESKCAEIKTHLKRQKHIQHLLLFFFEHNLSAHLAMKLYRRYGARAITVLQNNPYQLADDVFGVGFKTADSIAQKFGVSLDSPLRIRSGIIHCLKESAQKGHTYLHHSQLHRACIQLLECSHDIIERSLSYLSRTKQIIIEDNIVHRRIFLAHYYHMELNTAHHLRRILDSEITPLPISLGDYINSFESNTGLTLAAQQKQALYQIRSNNIVLLTGGPGTGKTTTIKAMVAILTAAGLNVCMAAPTGRAAKRMEDCTDHPAFTLHRLLGYTPKNRTFTANESNPLPFDALIIDEMSMINLPLFYSTLLSLKSGTRLIIVGDVDQLPPIGAGFVLRDIINSHTVPMIHLTYIFRQARNSAIITNAHRIKQGKAPQFILKPHTDFLLLNRKAPDEVIATLSRIIQHPFLKKYGINTHHNIQVIAPLHKGSLGVKNLNQLLQELLNPHSNSSPNNIGFFKGDRVMQIRNDYEKDVYNGDIGYITAVNYQHNELSVMFNHRLVYYDFSDIDELQLAYACTIHKSQGSEFPAVIIILHNQHYVMLRRNLLYTALTRAQKLAIIIGNKQAIHMAINRSRNQNQQTALEHRLRIPWSEILPGIHFPYE